MYPERFIIKVICNKCGVVAPTTYCILSLQNLLLCCLNCGEAEKFNTHVKSDVSKEKEEPAISKEELIILKELINKKAEKRISN